MCFFILIYMIKNKPFIVNFKVKNVNKIVVSTEDSVSHWGIHLKPIGENILPNDFTILIWLRGGFENYDHETPIGLKKFMKWSDVYKLLKIQPSTIINLSLITPDASLQLIIFLFAKILYILYSVA